MIIIRKYEKDHKRIHHNENSWKSNLFDPVIWLWRNHFRIPDKENMVLEYDILSYEEKKNYVDYNMI